MRSVMAAILALALTAGVAAAQGTAGVDGERGKFVRYDTTANVIVLEDGSMYRVGPRTVFIVEEKPVKYEMLQPGATVIIRSGEAVQFKDGQYIIITPSASPR